MLIKAFSIVHNQTLEYNSSNINDKSKKFGAERTYATYVENAWESGFWRVLNKTYFKKPAKSQKWACMAGYVLRA